MKSVNVPIIELQQNGTRLMLTSLKAGDLRYYTKVDEFNSGKPLDDPDQGYQRRPEQARIRRLGNWLKRELEAGGKVTIPTAILLSGRGADMRLNPDRTLTIRESTKLSIIDGQHRKLGYEFGIYEKGISDLARFDVPIVILPDVDKITEMKQFRIVNGEAKSVRTDLVNMILTQLAGLEGDDSIPDRDTWKVVVSLVVKRLNDDLRGPWYDKIVMPDGRGYTRDEVADDHSLQHRRIARATSIMTSLKPLETFLFEVLAGSQGSTEDRAERLFEVMDGFWRGLQTLNPVCFVEADDYVMQKTPGIFALHQVCHHLLPRMYQGRRAFTPAEFETMMRDCAEITSAEYWYVGPAKGHERGEAAKYGSMKGFSELATLLIDGLQR